MCRSNRTEVTVETSRVIAINVQRSSGSAYFPFCGCAAEMVTLDEATLLAGVSSRIIWHWIEGGKLHCRETTEGLLRICLRSLLNLRRELPGLSKSLSE